MPSSVTGEDVAAVLEGEADHDLQARLGVLLEGVFDEVEEDLIPVKTVSREGPVDLRVGFETDAGMLGRR